MSFAILKNANWYYAPIHSTCLPANRRRKRQGEMKNPRLHGFDDASMQKIKLFKGVLFLGKKSACFLFLFHDETGNESDEIKGDDMSDHPHEEIRSIRKMSLDWD